MHPTFLTSVTRIADFAERPPAERSVSRSEWRSGDYVLAEVTEHGAVPHAIENTAGRAVEVLPGDVIVGALGRRAATLEAVGDWRAVRDDLEMKTLTAGGLLGRCTSASTPPPRMAAVRYRGHAVRDGSRLTMADFVPEAPTRQFDAAIVLIVGTSMDAGKTVAAKAIVRTLKRAGLRVAAAKFTGVARYRDILAAADAGADFVADFVEAGLPSTAVPPEEFEEAARYLLSLIAASRPDVLVVEAGASPLEPYNGDVAVRLLRDQVRCTVLCASDPYAVIGVMNAFEMSPDLVSGRATSTEAGVDLINRLCGIEALNVMDRSSHGRLAEILEECLARGRPAL
jgi:uncharacterized protein DUF1611